MGDVLKDALTKALLLLHDWFKKKISETPSLTEFAKDPGLFHAGYGDWVNLYTFARAESCSRQVAMEWAFETLLPTLLQMNESVQVRLKDLKPRG